METSLRLLLDDVHMQSDMCSKSVEARKSILSRCHGTVHKRHCTLSRFERMVDRTFTRRCDLQPSRDDLWASNRYIRGSWPGTGCDPTWSSRASGVRSKSTPDSRLHWCLSLRPHSRSNLYGNLQWRHVSMHLGGLCHGNSLPHGTSLHLRYGRGQRMESRCWNPQHPGRYQRYYQDL